MKFEIVETRAPHIRDLVRRMRSEDRAEIVCSGRRPLNTLWRLWCNSSVCRTALVDDRVAAVWGCDGSLLDTEGRAWLFTTPTVERIPVTFFRQTRREVTEMLTTRCVLHTNVLASYKRSLAFFSRLGFRVSEPFVWQGTPYHTLTIERED